MNKERVASEETANIIKQKLTWVLQKGLNDNNIIVILRVEQFL